MFSKLGLFVSASVALFAVAAPSAISARTDSTCNSGTVYCCNSWEESSPATATLLAALLGANAGPVTGLVGVTCSAVTGVGLGSGGKCATQTACCKRDFFAGGVAIGCSPINVGL